MSVTLLFVVLDVKAPGFPLIFLASPREDSVGLDIFLNSDVISLDSFGARLKHLLAESINFCKDLGNRTYILSNAVGFVDFVPAFKLL